MEGEAQYTIKIHPGMDVSTNSFVKKFSQINDASYVLERGEYTPMERQDYIETVASALELLPPQTVICRLTGDGKAENLLAPLWSLKKTTVINDLDKLLYEKNTWQGRLYS